MNDAGPRSRIRLPEVPVLERDLKLGIDAVAALDCWRGRIGEIFTVTDPQQREYRARIVARDTASVTVRPFAEIAATESLLRIQLLQALPEKERFELVLQKATEIGVATISPFLCSRSTTPAERDAGQKKSHRWPELLLRASRQCRRAEIPRLTGTLDWQTAVDSCAAAELSLLCYEGDGSWPLYEAVQNFRGQTVALMIGPEGGFSTDEVDQARQRGILPVSLGPRMLRTETAAIVAAGLIQFAAGDLGR